jgi:spermidine/putrescine transport system permease protein
VLVFLFFVPLAIVAAYAFLSVGADGDPALPLSLEPARRAMDPLYLGILGHSVGLALATTLISVAVGFPVAWILTRVRGRARSVLLLALVLPSWTNLLVKNYAWIVILRQEGVLNGGLMRLGLIDEPLPLLFNGGAVLVGLVHTFLPFMILPLFVSIERLDARLIDAARDLGAGSFERMRRVVLPLSAPGVAAGAILVFVPALGAFVTPDLLGGATGMMVGSLIQNQMLTARDWPFGAVLALWLVAVTLVLLLLALRVGRGDAEGALP